MSHLLASGILVGGSTERELVKAAGTPQAEGELERQLRRSGEYRPSVNGHGQAPR
jgi:hypothetical protein